MTHNKHDRFFSFRIGVLFFIVVLFPVLGSAQIAYPANYGMGQPILLDSLHHQLNFYDLIHNPAALFEDESKKSLQMRVNGFYNSGDFRLPFMPETNNSQHYYFENIQPLSANDLFKGYFAFHRVIDQNVLWMDQQGPTGKNPFIYADSSKGDFTLNGIYWAVEWAHRFNQNWLGGVSFFYNVDQRLKQVFPKPLNKHRDIKVEYGLQYKNHRWSAGISAAYVDQQEKVEITKYNLQQNLTPVIFKFRFSDLPVIIRGKTSDERKIDRSGFSLSTQFRRSFHHSSVMGYYFYSKNNGTLTDGGVRNIKQGTFNQISKRIGVQLNYKLVRFEGMLGYYFSKDDFNAFHPDFGFNFWQAPSELHQIIVALKKIFRPDFSLFFDAGYGFYTENRIDLISVNYWRFQQRRLFFRSGFIYNINSHLEFDSWLGHDRIFNLNKERSVHSYSNFYQQLFYEPYLYYTQDKFAVTGGIQGTYHYLPVMDIHLILTHAFLRGISGIRREWAFSIGIKLFIF